MVIGTLHGSKDHCQDESIDSPSIFARLKNPSILEFIKNGQTLIETLFQAVKDGDLNLVKEITLDLMNVNPVDDNGITLLRTAKDYGQTKVVVFLLSELEAFGIDTAETQDVMNSLCKLPNAISALKLYF